MKTHIDPTTTAESLAEIIANASRAGATHAHVLKVGAKRAGVVPLAELDATYRGVEAEITFGTKAEGLPFEPMSAPVASVESDNPFGQPEDARPAPKAKPSSKKATSEVAGTKAEANTATPEAKPEKKSFVGSGFIAMIDKHLLDVDEETGKIEGFLRSKYSANEVVDAVLAKFPEKNRESVKKIVKVRPRHLEWQKVDARYDDVKHRAPRWRWVGPSSAFASPEAAANAMARKGTKMDVAAKRIHNLFPSVKDPVDLIKRAIEANTRTKAVKLPKQEIKKAKAEAKAKVAGTKAEKPSKRTPKAKDDAVAA